MHRNRGRPRAPSPSRFSIGVAAGGEDFKGNDSPLWKEAMYADEQHFLPGCGTGRITIEPHELLHGSQFNCPSCGASVSLHADGNGPLSQGLKAYDELRERLKKKA
jgi:predicted RNA-binding Zn-ribbon protein involved in translation (DUF1610 family)